MLSLTTSDSRKVSHFHKNLKQAPGKKLQELQVRERERMLKCMVSVKKYYSDYLSNILVISFKFLWFVAKYNDQPTVSCTWLCRDN